MSSDEFANNSDESANTKMLESRLISDVMDKRRVSRQEGADANRRMSHEQGDPRLHTSQQRGDGELAHPLMNQKERADQLLHEVEKSKERMLQIPGR